MTADQPLDVETPIGTAGERAMLEAFLDDYRGIIQSKLDGLSIEDARRRLVPSSTTLIGLVKHAAAVERGWFQLRLAGRRPEEITGHPRGDEASWRVGPDESIADVIEEHAAACATSRQIAAGFALEDAVEHPRMGVVSLRWIYVHMIEELARHAGHADILREQIDGTTSD